MDLTTSQCNVPVLSVQVKLTPQAEEMVVYVPNTGSMLNLVPPHLTDPLCVLSVAPANSKRKYQHTVEMIQVNQTYVGIHSALANKMVLNALNMDLIPELSGFCSIRQEVTVKEPDEDPQHPSNHKKLTNKSKTTCKKFKKTEKKQEVGSRIDFELLFSSSTCSIVRSDATREKASTSSTKKRKYSAGSSIKHETTPEDDENLGDISQRMLVEVKSVTLAPCDIITNADAEDSEQQQQERVAEFPDSVSVRAKKHAECLTRHVRSGGRAALLFLIQRDDCTAFMISPLDAAYKEAVREAEAAGVLILPYVCRLCPLAGVVELVEKVPFLG